MNDPYVYKGTNILVNTLNIKDYDRLEFVEKEITTIRLTDISRGLLTEGFYDIDHFQQFHRYIFGDIYPWAGEFRMVNILKNETALNGLPLEYMDHESVHAHLTWVLSKMNEYDWDLFNVEEKTYHFARVMSAIRRAHAFREGNTRMTLTFLSEFANYKGFSLQTSLFVHHAAYMRKALVASIFEDEALEKKRNYLHLENIIKDASLQGKI